MERQVRKLPVERLAASFETVQCMFRKPWHSIISTASTQCVVCSRQCNVKIIVASSMSALIDLTTDSDDHRCCPSEAAASSAREPSDDEAAPPAKRKKPGTHSALCLLQLSQLSAYDFPAHIWPVAPAGRYGFKIKISQIVPLVYDCRLTWPLERRQSGQADEDKGRETRGRSRKNGHLQSACIAEGAGADTAGAAR